MRTILLMIVALLGSLISLGAMQQQQTSEHKFDVQLAEAASSENIKIFRSLLIDALDKRNSVRVKKILAFITYDEAYSLIITWVPDTDVSMADKIQVWLDFLHTFTPSTDEDENFGELNSPVIYEPHPDSQEIFAPFTTSEKQDGL